MSTIQFAQFDSFKLNTKFQRGFYEHTFLPKSMASSVKPKTETWRRYKAPLGKGGEGTVWLEREERGALRVVKEMSKKHILSASRELLVLTKLHDQPQHFVKLLGWFENSGSILLALEYIEFGDLEYYISRGRVVPEHDVKLITKQLLEGVKIMHDNGFCHQDLKPKNVLMASLSPIVVKIADFGIAKQEAYGKYQVTNTGTPSYSAPEVIGFAFTEEEHDEGETHDNSIDIWSMGCLVYAIIIGESPFRKTGSLNTYFKSKQLPTSKLIERNTSASLISLIASMLKLYPHERITAKEALRGQWLRIGQSSQPPLWLYPQKAGAVEELEKMGFDCGD